MFVSIYSVSEMVFMSWGEQDRHRGLHAVGVTYTTNHRNTISSGHKNQEENEGNGEWPERGKRIAWVCQDGLS